MMNIISQLTTGQVLFIGIILMIATMLFPRLIRRKIQWKSSFKKSTELELATSKLCMPKQSARKHNGNRGEIDQLASKLLRYARANSMRLVYPGTVKHEGSVCDFAMLLVGKFGILAIKAYGFGGTIQPVSLGGDWQQTLNGKLHKFPNPSKQMDKDAILLKKALQEYDGGIIHVETAAVFTHKPLALTSPAGSRVYNQNSFLEFVCQSSQFCEDNGVAVTPLSEKLVQLVKGELRK